MVATRARIQRRERIRLAVRHEIRQQFPDLANQPYEVWSRGGSIALVYDHLDKMIEVVERNPSGNTKEWLRATEEEVCGGCLECFPSGFCLLRNHGCALQKCADLVFTVIKRELQLHPPMALS